jgi:phage replication O-like protein O
MDDNAKEPYTKIPNVLLDNAHTLSASAFMVVCAIARRTIGWHKERDVVSVSQIVNTTGLSRNTVMSALVEAVEVGWLVRSGVTTASGTGYSYEFRLIDTSAISAPVQNLDGGMPNICTTPSAEFGHPPVQKLGTQKKASKKGERKMKENSSRASRGEVVESVIDHSHGDESEAIHPPQEDDPFAFIPGVDDKPAVAEQKEKPAEKRQRKSKATLSPEEAQRHAELFDGIVRVCVVDAKLCGGHIARTAKQLREADPDANGAAMDAFLEWWKTSDFRGKQGKPPTIAQIAPAWKMFREGYAEINRSHVGSKSNDSVIDRIMRSVSFLGENNGN